MIIVQTPLRVSFFGGGTDFPSFYNSEGGCVLTSSIDKYIFVTVKQRFDDFLRIGYTKTEIVETVDQVQHELIREALRKTNIKRGVEITTMGDIPSGSGLGSSSAVTVGSLHAMYTYQNEMVSQERLAEEACDIEINILKKPIGKQDQYISAFGGMRFIEFHPGGAISSVPVRLVPSVERHLNECLLLFFTGITREAATILAEQNEKVENNSSALRTLKQFAHQAREVLLEGNIDQFGTLLDESWSVKKHLASQITNEKIEGMYRRAKQAGAWGGKITGAGGGGFLILLCPPECRETVRLALSDLRELPFQLTDEGTKVIFNHRH
jgi:D-glycero-alpha-D-manno-heptose-7-phosphate kinase